MGLIEFCILCFLVLAIAYAAVWCLGYFLPGHPPFVDKVIWFLAVFIIVVTLIRALGLMSYDPQIPSLRSR